MSPILTDFSPLAVIAAMEANLCALGQAFGQSPMTALHDSPGLLSYLTGIPHPVFNGVVHTDLKIEEADRRIDETLAPFQARGMPMMWVTGPSSQPADLGARLQALGFVQEDRPGMGAEDLGMAVDLLAVNESLPTPAGLTIEPVEDAAGCRQCIEAAQRGFDVSPEVADGWCDLLASLPFHQPMRHWVGRQHGEPVATASLLPGGGVAGIYNVSTIPPLRRQGIGTAMVLEALRAARAMGYRIGVLMAAPMGVSVYRRLGFTEFCLFGVYYWLGAPEAGVRAAGKAPRRANEV